LVQEEASVPKKLRIMISADFATGMPSGFAKFPGVYQPGAQGVTVPDGEEYYPSDGKGSDWRWHHGFMSYVPPGPPVWSG